MHSPTAMMTPEVYYIESRLNSHGKPKLTLSKTANNTKTILKPIPMIFLLKNAPHSLSKPEYSESNTVVQLYRGSNQPNVVVYADAGDVWFYIHGNISQSGNEKDVRRTLKAKYDYQLKKLGVKPDASDARQMISAALAKLGLKPRNNSFTPLYGMPAVLAANSMQKESKKTPTVSELTKKAIAYHESKVFGSAKDRQRSEDDFVEAATKWDALTRYQEDEFKIIWKSKKHDITEDMKRLARRAYLKKQKSKDSTLLAPWFCSILNKFKNYGKIDDSDTEEKIRIAKQYESLSGYDSDLILKCYNTKTLCFGPAQCMGHFQNILLEMEKNIYLYAMVLKKDGSSGRVDSRFSEMTSTEEGSDGGSGFTLSEVCVRPLPGSEVELVEDSSGRVDSCFSEMTSTGEG